MALRTGRFFSRCNVGTASLVQVRKAAARRVAGSGPIIAVGGRNMSSGVPKLCCNDPVTGFYRDGYCKTGDEDLGTHVICAEVTQEFLEYTKSRGNDLSTPAPMYRFPGLKPGDRWCLCASRWREAMLADKAPKVHLKSTHIKALQYVSLEDLKRHATDVSGQCSAQADTS